MPSRGCNSCCDRHALTDRIYSLSPSEYIKDYSKFRSTTPANVLGLTYFQSVMLFCLDKWPKQFRFSWINTPKERAQLAADRIDYFIAKGE